VYLLHHVQEKSFLVFLSHIVQPILLFLYNPHDLKRRLKLQFQHLLYKFSQKFLLPFLFQRFFYQAFAQHRLWRFLQALVRDGRSQRHPL